MGTQLWVELRAWEARANSYEAAVAGGKLFGKSDPIQVTLTEPPIDPPHVTVGDFSLVPEPSPMVLGLVSAAALLLRLRIGSSKSIPKPVKFRKSVTYLFSPQVSLSAQQNAPMMPGVKTGALARLLSVLLIVNWAFKILPLTHAQCSTNVPVAVPNVILETEVFCTPQNSPDYCMRKPKVLNQNNLNLSMLESDYDRAQRYRVAFVGAILHPDLSERLKASPIYTDLAYQALRSIQTIAPAGSMASRFASKLLSDEALVWEAQEIAKALAEFSKIILTNDISVRLERLQLPVQAKRFAETLKTYAVAFEAARWIATIAADVRYELLMHVIADAQTRERLECMEAFIKENQWKDPAVPLGFYLARSDIEDYLNGKPDWIRVAYDTVVERSSDYIIRFVPLLKALTDSLKPSFFSDMPQWAGSAFSASVTFLMLGYEVLKDAELAQSLFAAATIESDLYMWEQRMTLPDPLASDFQALRHKKILAQQLRYSLAFWYHYKFDEYLSPNASLYGVGTILADAFWGGSITSYRQNFLQPMIENNYRLYTNMITYLCTSVQTNVAPVIVTLPPRANISSITPNVAPIGKTLISFIGEGKDSDDYGELPMIRGYRWISSLGTISGTTQLYPGNSSSFGPDASFTMQADALRVGNHTIKLQVLDNDGQISDFATATLIITQENPPPHGIFLGNGRVDSPVLVGNDARYSVVYRNDLTAQLPEAANVVINGVTFNLLPGPGQPATGKVYYFSKTFNAPGTNNRFHFEFRVDGKLYRIPENDEYTGPIVESVPPVLFDAKVTPSEGDPNTSFTYEVTYRNSSGLGPSYDSVTLFVDSMEGIKMTRWSEHRNWSQGVTFRTTVFRLPVGDHTYRFGCAVGSSAMNTYSEVKQGPRVIEPGVVSINIMLVDANGERIDNIPIGEKPRFKVEVRAGARLVTPSYWSFERATDGFLLYSGPECPLPPCGRTGDGTFYFEDYNIPGRMPGLTTYRMRVEVAGYPPSSNAIDVGERPEEPVKIADVKISPTVFKPGAQNVSVNYNLSLPSKVVIRLLDLSGRVVRTLVGPNAERSSGAQFEIWDGRDDLGNFVGEGEYMVHIAATRDISTMGDNALDSPFEIGERGEAPTQLSEPRDLIWDPFHNVILVADEYPNPAVKRYKPTGEYDGYLNLCDGTRLPGALVQDALGNIYVADNTHLIWKYKRDWTCVGLIASLGDGTSWGYEDALTTDGHTYLYCTRNHLQQIVRMKLDGSDMITKELPSTSGDQLITGLAVDDRGRIWAAFSQTSPFKNKLICYDANLNPIGEINHDIPSQRIDLDVKFGSLLYMRTDYNLRIYDLENGNWLPINKLIDGHVPQNGIDAVEDGYTYVLGDLSLDTRVHRIVRFRDRISTDKNYSRVKATLIHPLLAQIDNLVLHDGRYLEVLGSAAGANFARYTLEVGYGQNPTAWSVLTNSQVAVTNAVLGNWDLQGLPAGSYTIRLRAYDSTDNQSEAIHSYTINSTDSPPQTYVTGPAGETVPEDTVTLYLSAEDDNTVVENIEYSWKLNNREWSPFAKNSIIILSEIGRGTHLVQVRARDASGLIDPTPAVISFSGTVDHAPDMPSCVYPLRGQTDVTLTPMLVGSAFSDPDPASSFARSHFQVRNDTETYESPLLDRELVPPSSYFQVPSGTLRSGARYWWRVRHCDDTGLWSAWSTESSFSTMQVPRLEIIVTGNQFVLAWSTNYTGYVLETTDQLQPESSWSPVPQAPVVVGSRYFVGSNFDSSSRFYRLRK